MTNRRVVLTLGVAAIGLVAGWLTGQSGFDEKTTAALLSAIVPIVGGGVLGWYAFKPDAEHYTMIGFMLIAFSLAIAGGAQVGVNQSRALANADYKQAQLLHWARLRECAVEELRLNLYRTRLLELEPLPPQTYCLLPNQPPPRQGG